MDSRVKKGENMKVVFFSNYFNHYQRSLSDAIYNIIGDDFCFIETEERDEKRVKLGWNFDNIPSYVKQSYVSANAMNECKDLILSADVAITGSADATLEKLRLETGKLTFKYSERLNKPMEGNWKKPLRTIKNFFKYHKYENLYLLCASAYVSYDFGKSGLFKNKAYKWGYFPALKKYEDVNELMSHKKTGSIVWAARLLDWKHPGILIDVAERLKNTGYNDFKINIVGSGELEDNIRTRVKEKHLETYVELCGAMSPEKVREYMENAQIFLFTSDFNEGWGCVLNEAMNSACAVVASHAAGSTPYLIHDHENGFIYKSGDLDELYEKVKTLLDNRKMSDGFGKNAYETMLNTWNANVAAERFLCMAKKLLNKENVNKLYNEGPLSTAEIIKNNWRK